MPELYQLYRFADFQLLLFQLIHDFSSGIIEVEPACGIVDKAACGFAIEPEACSPLRIAAPALGQIFVFPVFSPVSPIDDSAVYAIGIIGIRRK